MKKWEEFRETVSLNLYQFHWLADMLSISGKEKIYIWDDISLPVFEWRPNTAMTVSVIQF